MPETSLPEIRKKFPQYDDMSDDELARRLHQRAYSDMPFDEFSKRIGLSQLAGDQAAASGPQKPREMPVLLPLQRVQDGEGIFGSSVDFGPSQLTESIGRAFTAPRRAMTDGMTFEQMNDEALNMATLAGTGTVARSAAPIAIREGANLARAGAEALGSPAVSQVVAGAKSAAQRAGEVTGISRIFDVVIERLPSNVDKAAARRLVQRLEQDGLSIDEIDGELKRLGRMGTLADAGGRNIQGQTRKLIQEPGQTAQLADDILEPRQATQGTRVVESVRRNISDKNFYGEMDKIAERQMNLASPLYKQAFAANKSVSSPLIDRILNTPQGKDALAYARERLQNRMSRMAVPDKELTDQLKDLVSIGEAAPVKGGVASGLKLETLDLVKQALGEAEQEMKRRVVMGKAKKGEAADIGDLRRSLTAELDRLDVTAKAGPNSTKAEGGAYARARRVWSDDASILDAMDAGRAFAKGDEEITAKTFGALNRAEREAFRVGAAREMIATIRKTGLTPPALKNALRDTAIRDKIKLIAPSNKQFEDFVQTLDREARFSQTNALRGGSQTGLLAAEGADMGMDFSGAVIAGATGNPMGATTSAISTAINWLKRAGVPQAVKDRMGRMLLSTDPEDQRQALQLMRQIQSTQRGQLPSRASPSITGGRK